MGWGEGVRVTGQSGGSELSDKSCLMSTGEVGLGGAGCLWVSEGHVRSLGSSGVF